MRVWGRNLVRPVTHQEPCPSIPQGVSLYTSLRVSVISRFSRVQLSATLWTVAHEAPLSLGFSRQEY